MFDSSTLKMFCLHFRDDRVPSFLFTNAQVSSFVLVHIYRRLLCFFSKIQPG